MLHQVWFVYVNSYVNYCLMVNSEIICPWKVLECSYKELWCCCLQDGWHSLRHFYMSRMCVCARASLCLELFVCVIALLKVKPFIIAPKFTAAIIFTVYIMLLVIQNFGGQQESGSWFVHLSDLSSCAAVSVLCLWVCFHCPESEHFNTGVNQGFLCPCLSGYDFCAEGLICGENSECKNRNTKAECECKSGYASIHGDSTYCEGRIVLYLDSVWAEANESLVLACGIESSMGGSLSSFKSLFSVRRLFVQTVMSWY